MPIYDFKNLSPYDFELLSKDLLEKELYIKLENFKSGRDQGIDLRCIKVDHTIIIQCKHYANSTFSSLRTSLKKELPKIRKIKPERYIITTSFGLSATNKDEIKGLLSPYIITSADIYDSEALNSLLRKFPDVEKLHFKLWLSSSAVLQKILHSSIETRSHFKKSEIKKQIKLYVETNSFFAAMKILQEYNYCVITGEPGVGKTTLANIISYQYISNDFEFYEITKIDDAFKVLKPTTPQIFYYDDFLGDTRYQSKNEDSDLIKFTNYLSNAKNKKLVMTTREYILKQAENKSEEISQNELQKCIIQQSDYYKFAKAKILYNHIYFSDLPDDYYLSIINNKNYLKIVDHPNYSPRIIEWMTRTNNFQAIPSDDYYNVFLNNLDNPMMIWNHVFENNISELSQYILLILINANDKLPVMDCDKLLRAWYYKNNPPKILSYMTLQKHSLKELAGTFLKLESIRDITVIEFSNPSIKDFLEQYLARNTKILEDFLDSPLVFWDQKLRYPLLISKDNMCVDERISEIVSKNIEKILDEALENINLSSVRISRYSNFYFEIDTSLFERLQTLHKISKYFLKQISNFFEQDLFNIFSLNFEQKEELDYRTFELIQSFPNSLFSQEQLNKLNLFMTNCEDIESLKYLVDLNEKLNFYDYENDSEIDQIIENCFEEIEMGDDETSNDLMETLNLIEEICTYFGIDSPRIAQSISERISEIENEESLAEDMSIEYGINRYRESKLESTSLPTFAVSEDDNIELMFSTLKDE